MQAFVVEIAFTHAQDDIDWREVEADTRAEAEAVAATLFRREAWGVYHDPVITSVAAEPLPARRYSLDLHSDAEDLDLTEVVR